MSLIRGKHPPWVGGPVHLLQVQGGLQLTLATGQEHDAWHSGGHAAAQHGQGGVGNLGGGAAGLALGAGGNHGGLEQDTLKQDLQAQGGAAGYESVITKDWQGRAGIYIPSPKP